jgi:hypothetical protein
MHRFWSSTLCIWTMKLINKGFLVDKLKSLLRKFYDRHQGFLVVKVKSSLRKVNGRHHDLVSRYGIYMHKWQTSFDTKQPYCSPVNKSIYSCTSNLYIIVHWWIKLWFMGDNSSGSLFVVWSPINKLCISDYDKWNISVVICDTDIRIGLRIKIDAFMFQNLKLHVGPNYWKWTNLEYISPRLYWQLSEDLFSYSDYKDDFSLAD